MHVDGIAEPLVASRSERAILADVEAALAEAAGVPRRRGGGAAARARTRCSSRANKLIDPVSFYVTTPIYYVNAEPHLGHAYSTIAADVLARHHRQRGEDVFFLTGTDEHGEPVALAAEREGVDAAELVDRNAPRFRELVERLDASNDFFIRTTDPEHMAKVQEVVQRVYDNGHVYEGLYEGWYCPRCADFKTEAERGPDNTCPIHEIPLDWESQQNWFFKPERLPGAARAPVRRAPGLRASRRFGATRRSRSSRAGSRTSRSRGPKLSWGVPVPWDPEQVIYVWWDALLNYYTALSYAREGEDLTERFWPADLHVIAKDILKFHTVYWPAFLLAAGIEPPRHVYVHGFLLMGEKKMSKSLGNVLDPNEVIERFGPDALRFYCMREVSFGQDGSVSAAGFESRYETELANDWGNLASRTLAMIERYRDGVSPRRESTRRCATATTRSTGIDGVVRELLDRVELTQALEAIWSRVRRLNRYVEETQALGAGQGRVAGRAGWTPCSTTSPRGSGCWRCCCIRTCPRPAAGCSRRSPRAIASSTRSAPAAAAPGRADRAAVPEAGLDALRRPHLRRDDPVRVLLGRRRLRPLPDAADRHLRERRTVRVGARVPGRDRGRLLLAHRRRPRAVRRRRDLPHPRQPRRADAAPENAGVVDLVLDRAVLVDRRRSVPRRLGAGGEPGAGRRSRAG